MLTRSFTHHQGGCGACSRGNFTAGTAENDKNYGTLNFAFVRLFLLVQQKQNFLFNVVRYWCSKTMMAGSIVNLTMRCLYRMHTPQICCSRHELVVDAGAMKAINASKTFRIVWLRTPSDSTIERDMVSTQVSPLFPAPAPPTSRFISSTTAVVSSNYNTPCDKLGGSKHPLSKAADYPLLTPPPRKPERTHKTALLSLPTIL